MNLTLKMNEPTAVTPNHLAHLYARVRRGVALLDQRVPNWRRTMRKQAQQYDFMDGEHCVLGTLEHFNGRLKVLRKRTLERSLIGDAMVRATMRLRIAGNSSHFGFCWATPARRETDGPILHALWQQEFQQDPSTTAGGRS